MFALIVIVIKLVIIFDGASRVAKGDITVGTIIALISFTDRVYTPIAIFNVLFVDYKLDKIAYGRFLDFLKLPDDRNLNEGDEFKPSRGSIEFSGAGFSYGDAAILDSISLCIPGGSSAAIVGSNGAGKSTMLKILLGLLKATKGKVLVDWQDLKRINLDTYYEHVSYVSQDAPVFDGTLRENIVFDEYVPDEAIISVLELVQLREFAANLPQGLDTEVGERGIKLSGGEKQRLAFARVFFQKSRIVILDEPTSALDSITEEAVTGNMLKILKDRTIILIAHRLQTVRNADRIFVLDGGRLAESGTLDELLHKDGLFRKLWEKQR